MNSSPPQETNIPPLDAANAMYSLCLVIVLTFSFHFDEHTKSIEPCVDGLRAVLVVLYLTYFLLDWGTVNLYRRTTLGSPFAFWSSMIGIPFLTIAILSLYSIDDWKFAMISAYAFAVALWDALFLSRARKQGRIDRVVQGIILAALRVAVASFVLIPALFGLFGRPDVFQTARNWFVGLSIALVILKGLRLRLLWLEARPL